MVQKPVGQRLDNARAAQLRSEKRLDDARQGLALARQTVQAAAEEHTRLLQEVSDLEASISSAPATAVDTMEGLREHMKSALAHPSELELDPNIHADATSQTESLFLKFQSTMEQAALAAANVQAARRKHSSKSAPVRHQDYDAVRHCNKHPPSKKAAVGVKNPFCAAHKRGPEESSGDDLELTSPPTGGPSALSLTATPAQSFSPVAPPAPGLV